jgi:prepilin-type N-terminal cleavage/methylation domain-containing protein
MIKITIKITSRRGFTLLELLVAVALTAVMITVVAGAFAAGLRVWQRASQMDGPYQDAVLALELIQKDVRNTVPFRLVPFRGGASLIEMPALVAVPLPGGAQEQPGSIRYEFSAATRRLERITRTFSIPDGEKESREVILDKVEQVRFAYADRGPDGKAALSWSDTWSPGTNSPAAVKVTLRAPPSVDFERMIVQPRTPTQDFGPRTH